MVKNTVLTKGYMITFIWILNLFSKKKTLHVVRMKWSIIIQIDLYILELSNAVPWWSTRSRNFWNEDAMWFTKNAETTEANKTSAIPMHFKNCAMFKATLRLLVSMVTNQRWDAFKVFMIFVLFLFLFVFWNYAFFAKYQSRRMSLICFERIYELVYYFIYKITMQWFACIFFSGENGKCYRCFW